MLWNLGLRQYSAYVRVESIQVNIVNPNFQLAMIVVFEYDRVANTIWGDDPAGIEDMAGSGVKIKSAIIPHGNAKWFQVFVGERIDIYPTVIVEFLQLYTSDPNLLKVCHLYCCLVTAFSKISTLVAHKNIPLLIQSRYGQIYIYQRD